MDTVIARKFSRLLRETANKIDAGNCEVDSEQAIKIMGIIAHEPLSKAQACDYLNMGRSKFDELINTGKLPQGRKKKGYNNLIWYKDELII